MKFPFSKASRAAPHPFVEKIPVKLSVYEPSLATPFKTTSYNFRRHSALMYAGVLGLSMATLLALLGIKPVAYLVLKGRSSTPILPEITTLASSNNSYIFLALSKATSVNEDIVKQTYENIMINNQSDVIPAVFINRFGSYKLNHVNQTTYYVLLTLTHLVTTKQQFDVLVLSSPDDGVTNSFEEIIEQAAQTNPSPLGP